MEHARRVLEWETVLDRLAFACETELAAQSALALEPHTRLADVRFEQERTTEAYEVLADQTPPSLGPCRDVRMPWRKAEKGGVLGGQELFQIGEALAAMRSMKAFLKGRPQASPRLYALSESLADERRVETDLLDALEPNGDVKDGASSALASLRSRKKGAQSRIHERIQAHLAKHRDLLSDPIYTVRDGRYVIPVKAEHRGKVRGVVHDTSGTGQTLFIEPDDVLAAANQLREVEAAEREEVVRILTRLSALAGAVAETGANGLEVAGQIDLLFAKARLAYAMHAQPPFLREDPGLKFRGGRHPVLEATLGDQVVPIDLEVGLGKKGLLITGPNTGGKTLAIKTVGLFALMGQSGLYLPAEHSELGPFTQVWADIGDEQSIQQSLSTFSAHLKNISEALKALRPGALALFDEIGAGTDPAEGAALAKAILNHFVERGAIVLASTHYGELKAFAYETDGFANAAMEFDPKTLRPTYRVLMGAPGASHALRIAERYGIPKPVVESAREFLDGAERDIAQLIEKLEEAQRQARIAQGEADRRLHELRQTEARAKKKLDEADEIRRNVHAKAGETVEAALREIRLEAQRLFDELKANPGGKNEQRVREGLKDLQRIGQSFAEDIKPKAKPKSAPARLNRGDQVKVEGFTQIGTVLAEPNRGQVEVQMGPLKMSFPIHKLTPVAAPAKPSSGVARGVQLQKAMSATTELHLRAMRAEDAEIELQKFLDEAILGGVHQVRIVHGKGEGILRKLTQDALRRHSGVKLFRDGEPAEGGAGVTIAILK